MGRAGSGSPSPVEVAPAGLCCVVASFFSAPGSGSPSPVEVAPAGLCRVDLASASWEVAPAGLDSSSSAKCSPFSALPSFFRPGWHWFVWILTNVVLTKDF